MRSRERGDSVITGQPVAQVKLARARELRRNMTPEERLLWQRLRAKRFRGLHVRPQQIIDGFIVDFYCHAARLVVEVDGPIHDPVYDAKRDKTIARWGLKILRVTNDEVRYDMAGVLAKIAALTDLHPAPSLKGGGA